LTTAAATSPDGINWTAQTIPAVTNGVADLIWDGTNFVGCPFSGISTPSGIQSPDGVTWATIPSISVAEGRLAAKPSALPVTGASSTVLQAVTGSAVAYYGISSQVSLSPITGSAVATLPVIASSSASVMPVSGSAVAITLAVVGGSVTAQKMTVSAMALPMPILQFEQPVTVMAAGIGIVSTDTITVTARASVAMTGAVGFATLTTTGFSVSAQQYTVSQTLGLVTMNNVAAQKLTVAGSGFVGIIGVSP
jgi:hypothetical protein